MKAEFEMIEKIAIETVAKLYEEILQATVRAIRPDIPLETGLALKIIQAGSGQKPVS